MRHRGGRLHRRRPPRPGRRQLSWTTAVSVLLGNGDGTFQPQDADRGRVCQTRMRSWRGTSTATAASTSPSRTAARRHRLGAAGQRRRHVPAPVTYAVGDDPDAIVAGDFNGDGRLDLAVANDRVRRHRVGAAGQRRRHVPAPGHLRGRDTTRSPSWRGTSTATATSTSPSPTKTTTTCSVLLGNGDGTFQPQVTYAVGTVSDRDRGGRLHRRRPPRPRRRQRRSDGTVSVLLGNGDGTFQPPVTYAVGSDAPDAHRGGRLHRRRPPRPGRRQRIRLQRSDSVVSVLLGNGDGTFQPQVTYAVGSSTRTAIVAGDFTGDGHLDLAVAERLDDGTVSRAAGQRRRHVPAPGHLRASAASSTAHGGGRLQRRRPRRPGRRRTSTNDVSVLLGNGDGTFAVAGTVRHRPHAPTPWWPTSTATAPTTSWSSTAPATSSIARASPASPAPSSRPSRSIPDNPSRDIAWLPDTADGPLLASVDAQDDAVSLYAYRDGAFVRVGSLTTGQLPAQIIAADLDRRRLGRPGRPQCRRRHALGLLQRRARQPLGPASRPVLCP